MSNMILCPTRGGKDSYPNQDRAVALAAGLLAASWGERYRRRFVQEELDRSRGEVGARRAAEQAED